MKLIIDVPPVEDKKVVLICDDSKTCLQVVKKGLSKEYHVITASSGYEAIAFASLYFPDVIIMDVMMYGMNGFEAIKKIKMNPVTKDIPVIFLSGLTEDKYVQQGLELGAKLYIEKPLDLNVLVNGIDSVIKEKNGNV